MVEPTHLKNFSQIGHLPPNRDENKKCLKPPPSKILERSWSDSMGICAVVTNLHENLHPPWTRGALHRWNHWSRRLLPLTSWIPGKKRTGKFEAAVLGDGNQFPQPKNKANKKRWIFFAEAPSSRISNKNYFILFQGSIPPRQWKHHQPLWVFLAGT